MPSVARALGRRAAAAAVVFAVASGGDIPESSPPLNAPNRHHSTVSRLGSFLVLGDWGWDPLVHGNHMNQTCQRSIAELMNKTVRELGDVRFVINVGDSFYPNGVASKEDWQWNFKWRGVYPQAVRDVPWFSVYGNHDLHIDPCICEPLSNVSACAQVNANLTDRDFFYMPNTSWSLEVPEMNAEVIAMETNILWAAETCRWTLCPANCTANMKARAEVAFELFYERARRSNASNLLVFSHYPTDYYWGYPDFLEELSRNVTEETGVERHIEFFGGHRHNVDQESTTSIEPNGNWLVGGGGGWGCDGDRQGFLVGEIASDGTLSTRPVLVDPELCCSHAWWWNQPTHRKM